MSDAEYDHLVVGGVPGGYTAAIRAVQLGMRVAVVEKEKLGGVCLNVGCIPTKALLKNAEILQTMRRAAEWGITFDNLRFDFAKGIKRSRSVADRLSRGVEYLMKKNGIETIAGHARLTAPETVEIEKDGKMVRTIHARHIVLATGARPRELPGLPFDGKRILTSTDAMTLPEKPRSIVIVGAGAIGVEFAYFFNAVGTKVTVVEMMAGILPIEDRELTKLLETSLKKQGIDILTETKVAGVTTTGEGVEVAVDAPDGRRVLGADVALISVGVRGNVENLGLEKLGVAVEKGYIKVDQGGRTNVAGVYAIGDVIGPPWLAHVASAEGIHCVETIAGKDPPPLDYSAIPGCTYCQPQLASVGLTEEKAKAEGYELKIGRFPLRVLGKAVAMGESEGMVKLLFDAKYGELLGAHILGADATEMIAGLALARRMEMTGEQIFHTIHPHPTLSEGIMEAAAAASGEAINI